MFQRGIELSGEAGRVFRVCFVLAVALTGSIASAQPITQIHDPDSFLNQQRPSTNAFVANSTSNSGKLSSPCLTGAGGIAITSFFSMTASIAPERCGGTICGYGVALSSMRAPIRFTFAVD